MFDSTTIEDFDPEVAKALAQESQRQEQHIELIASENYASPQVMAAQGSKLTNKYAEGYPGKRYYGGCEFVDDVETLANLGLGHPANGAGELATLALKLFIAPNTVHGLI